jgi:endonuclease YncB( thermonuclease family)
MKPVKLVLLLALLLPVFDVTACYPAIKATVTEVVDGDTFNAVDKNTGDVMTIRMAEIDAPEESYKHKGIFQDYALESKQALSDLVFGKTVSITPLAIDVQGRYLSKVSFNGVDINKKMILTGAAWAYEPYVFDKSLFDAQTKAKNKSLGLWALPNPLAPWIWKKTN